VRKEEAVRNQFRKGDRGREEGVVGDLRGSKTGGGGGPRGEDEARSKREGFGRVVDLQWEYEAMMGRPESLRSVRECATADMLASRSRIHEAYPALTGCTVEEASLGVELTPYSDVESNLTLERLEVVRQ